MNQPSLEDSRLGSQSPVSILGLACFGMRPWLVSAPRILSIRFSFLDIRRERLSVRALHDLLPLVLALALLSPALAQETNSDQIHDTLSNTNEIIVEHEPERTDSDELTNEFPHNTDLAQTNEILESTSPSLGSKPVEIDPRITVVERPGSASQPAEGPRPTISASRTNLPIQGSAAKAEQGETGARGDSDRSDRATTTSAPRATTKDFSEFRIIAERNIFDPNRQPYRTRREPAPRPRNIESFALVGVMSYDKGTFAFFDGTNPSYKKVLKQNDRIAGYTVSGIEPNSVKLTSGSNQVDLRIGMQLRRADEGAWSVGARTEAYASSPASSPTSSTSLSSSSSSPQPSGSASNDRLEQIRERLRKQREQN